MNVWWIFERILYDHYDPLQRKFSRAILFVDVTTPIRPHQAWSLRGQGLSRPICLTEFLIAAAESTQASFNKNCSNKLRLKWISRIWTEKTSGSIWPWPGGWLWQTKVIKLVWSPQHCFPSLSAHRSSTKVGPHLPWTVGGTSSEVWEIWTFSIIPLRPFLILSAH